VEAPSSRDESTPGGETDVRWTQRQRQVFALIARGRSNAEIAETLGISIDGAKWHMREILSKLGVDTREEAADYWRAQNGLRTRLFRMKRIVIGGLGWKLAGGAAAVAVGGIAVGVVVGLGARSHGPQPSSSASEATPRVPTTTAISEEERAALQRTPTGPTTIIAWYNGVVGGDRLEMYRTAAGWCHRASQGATGCGFTPQLDANQEPILQLLSMGTDYYADEPGAVRITLGFPADVARVQVHAATSAPVSFTPFPAPEQIGMPMGFAYLGFDAAKRPFTVIAYDASGAEFGRLENIVVP
jgi:DNA-binding CsgD family transcriptional regulator